MTCTTLDHCCPQNAPDRKTHAGGSRRALKALKAGATVVVAGAAHEGTRTVVKFLRDDSCYVLSAPVYGRKYYERVELEAVAQ
jgi:hypothetical protein